MMLIILIGVLCALLAIPCITTLTFERTGAYAVTRSIKDFGKISLLHSVSVGSILLAGITLAIASICYMISKDAIYYIAVVFPIGVLVLSLIAKQKLRADEEAIKDHKITTKAAVQVAPAVAAVAATSVATGGAATPVALAAVGAVAQTATAINKGMDSNGDMTNIASTEAEFEKNNNRNMAKLRMYCAYNGIPMNNGVPQIKDSSQTPRMLVDKATSTMNKFVDYVSNEQDEQDFITLLKFCDKIGIDTNNKSLGEISDEVLALSTSLMRSNLNTDDPPYKQAITIAKANYK